MKILLDSCVWGGSKGVLLAAGHDVVWTGDWPSDPGDREILTIAHQERRVLVTLDKDFGELATVHGVRHSGVMRLVGFRAREQGDAIRQLVGQFGADLLLGALVIAYPDRVRIRPADDQR